MALATSATWTLLITLSGMVSEGSTEFTTLSEGTFVELLTSLLLLRPLATAAEVTFSDGPLITLDIIEADDDDVADDELVVEAGMAIMPVLAIIVWLISNEHAN